MNSFKAHIIPSPFLSFFYREPAGLVGAAEQTRRFGRILQSLGSLIFLLPSQHAPESRYEDTPGIKNPLTFSLSTKRGFKGKSSLCV